MVEHVEFYQSMESNYSPLETNILMLWKNGHSVKKIAQTLKLASSTILFCLKNIEVKASLHAEEANA